MRAGLLLLRATVGLILLIVCANLANLLLARSIAKLPELGVRLALGATALRLARVVAAESLLLALGGGLLGTGLAAFGLPFIAPNIPPALLPRAHEVALQPTAVAVGIPATLLCAIIPAWRLAHADVNQWTKEGSARGATSHSAGRWQSALVTGQIALTVIVLAAALLLMRSLVSLQSVPPGFRPENVLTVRLAPPPTHYETNAELATIAHLVDEVSTVPGVVAASVNASTPLTGITLTYPSWREGTTTDAASALDSVYAPVSPDDFKTVQLPLKRGRLLNEFDTAEEAPVAVINETYARRMFPGRDPIGQRLMLIPWMGAIYREIVGVVADTRQSSLADPAPPQIYVPQKQMPWFFSTLLIRIESPSVVPAVRAKLRATDPSLPLSPQLLGDLIAEGSVAQRLQAYLFGGFAVFALLLSAFGLDASLCFTLAQTLREIGIRIALGASPANIAGLVLSRVGRLIGVGLVVGLALSMPITQSLRTQLYGLGTALPLALRASRVNPATILQPS
ncbi:MAG: ABC transporter permease [Candidatus Synoicihabitans palmerolidicus]|nr:ABC transporter permease [Candidatus Synoicihabitans palmerolidicus]